MHDNFEGWRGLDSQGIHKTIPSIPSKKFIQEEIKESNFKSDQ